MVEGSRVLKIEIVGVVGPWRGQGPGVNMRLGGGTGVCVCVCRGGDRKATGRKEIKELSGQGHTSCSYCRK